MYDWDFPRQLLHLRAAEAAGVRDADRLEGELYDRRFLVARPLLKALETQPSVLLVDEVDRADDEFEAFLLELLSEFSVTIPELGTLRADVPPVVVLTSNRTREVHDALKRRCLYHWFDHPGFARELAIVRRRLPGVSARLAEQVTALVQALRSQDLLKPPGVAETIDWTEALDALGANEVDAELAVATLGSVLKYREDMERARGLDLSAVLAARGACAAWAAVRGGRHNRRTRAPMRPRRSAPASSHPPGPPQAPVPTPSCSVLLVPCGPPVSMRVLSGCMPFCGRWTSCSPGCGPTCTGRGG